MHNINDPTVQAPQVPFDEFIVYVTAAIAGVPAEAAGFAVRLAAIEWAQRTRAIKRTIRFEVLRAVQEYPLFLADSWSLVGISEVTVDGSRVGRSSGPGNGCSRTYAFEMPDAFYLNFPPSRDGAGEMRVVVSPGQDSCFIDRWVYDQHAETLALGARARLLGMTTEPWYNPSAAQQTRREFDRALARATAADRGGYSSEPQLMTTPRGSFL